MPSPRCGACPQPRLDVAVEPVLLDPAQVAYFLSWPVLGSAVILAWQPSPGEMSHMVKDSGIANETQLHDVRVSNLHGFNRLH